jgi:hypothetical protein
MESLLGEDESSCIRPEQQLKMGITFDLTV